MSLAICNICPFVQFRAFEAFLEPFQDRKVTLRCQLLKRLSVAAVVAPWRLAVQTCFYRSRHVWYIMYICMIYHFIIHLQCSYMNLIYNSVFSCYMPLFFEAVKTKVPEVRGFKV